VNDWTLTWFAVALFMGVGWWSEHERTKFLKKRVEYWCEAFRNARLYPNAPAERIYPRNEP
jgi:hypothetical protein